MVSQRIQSLLVQIFEQDYKINLVDSDFIWTRSEDVTKLSLHLTIATHDPQYVFEANDRCHPHGAYYMMLRLLQKDPELAQVIDATVYSRHRLMRIVGSCKFGKQNVLVPVRGDLAGASSSLSLYTACVRTR